jgi:hypothetical protein
MADQISLRDILARRQALKTAIIAEAEVRVMAPQTGWIATAEWTGDAAEPITQLDSTWIVPPNPSTQSSQVIFLFNSLEITGARILQPVLSWGPISDVPGSGPFWTIASWYVGNPGEPFYLTQPKRVNPGQKLTGRITMYYNGGGLFDYGCEFVGIDGTKLIAGNLPQLVRQLKRSRPISLRAIATIQIRREQLSPAYRFGAAAIPFTLNGARAAYSPISFRSRREELK